MPFEIRIRQSGLFRKKLETEDLTAGVFSIGMHDRFLRMISMIPNEGFVIVYDPDHIGTGMRVKWNPEETEELCVCLPGITTLHDINMMKTVLEKIMKKWHAPAALFEGKEYSRENLDDLGSMLLEKTMGVLADVHSNYCDDITLVHGALWPLMFETEKLRKYGKEKDAEGFAALLHDLQSRNVYWCACHVYLYDDQKSYQGVYSITSGVDTVIPLKPMPPVNMTDPATGDEIECRRYLARIVSPHSRRPIMQMEYHKFLEMIHAETIPLYDACHVVYCADQEKLLKEAERREEMEGRPCW